MGFLPGPILVVVVLLAAMLGGMIWAAVPGILKVKTGAHEVVTTIMMNGIAISLVAWAINFPLQVLERAARAERRPPHRSVPGRAGSSATSGSSSA